MAVLIAGQPKSAYYELLQSHTLPDQVTWAFEDHQSTDSVLVETVHRFKGLETSIEFLWGIDELDEERDRETFYVGTSRAKSILYLVGTERTCHSVVANL